MKTINLINEKDGTVFCTTEIKDRTWNGMVRLAKARRIPLRDLFHEAFLEWLMRRRTKRSR